MPCCDQSQHLCFTPLPLYSVPVPLTLVEKPFFLLKFPWFSSVKILCEGCLSINRKWTLDGFKSKTWNLFHETTCLKSYSWKKVNKFGRKWKKLPLFSFPLSYLLAAAGDCQLKCCGSSPPSTCVFDLLRFSAGSCIKHRWREVCVRRK